MEPMIPMYVKIEGKKVLILGGGEEAYKKARRYLRHGAFITVYSLEFRKEFEEFSKDKIKLIKGDARDYEMVEKLIDEHFLVIYAIPESKDIEEFVRKKCEEKNKLYILTTNAKDTMVAMPMEGKIHGIRFTTFSGGKSSLASLEALEIVKKCLEKEAYLGTLVDAMGFLKKYMLEKGIHYENRMKIYRSVFREPTFREYIKRGDLEGAKNFLIHYVHNFLG